MPLSFNKEILTHTVRIHSIFHLSLIPTHRLSRSTPFQTHNKLNYRHNQEREQHQTKKLQPNGRNKEKKQKGLTSFDSQARKWILPLLKSFKTQVPSKDKNQSSASTTSQWCHTPFLQIPNNPSNHKNQAIRDCEAEIMHLSWISWFPRSKLFLHRSSKEWVFFCWSTVFGRPEMKWFYYFCFLICPGDCQGSYTKRGRFVSSNCKWKVVGGPFIIIGVWQARWEGVSSWSSLVICCFMVLVFS